MFCRLYHADCRLHFGYPLIAAKAVMQPSESVAGQRVHDLVRLLAMIFPGPGARPRPGIAQQQHATLSARGHDLLGAEGKGGGITHETCHLSFPDRTMRLCALLVTEQEIGRAPCREGV